MNTLLELLEQDCTQSPAQLAAQAGMTEAEAKDELRRLEEEGVILGYQAVIDWDRVKRENVTALIEVKVTPQSLARTLTASPSASISMTRWRACI